MLPLFALSESTLTPGAEISISSPKLEKEARTSRKSTADTAITESRLAGLWALTSPLLFPAAAMLSTPAARAAAKASVMTVLRSRPPQEFEVMSAPMAAAYSTAAARSVAWPLPLAPRPRSGRIWA